MAEKQQWKLRVTPELVDRLKRLGAQIGYQTPNEFAADALDEWAELLAEITAELHDEKAASKKRIRDRIMSQIRSERRK